MENEAMLNAEDLGFDAEDLEEAGLDKQKPATPAGNDSKDRKTILQTDSRKLTLILNRNLKRKLN